MNITEALKKSNHVRRKAWGCFYVSAIDISGIPNFKNIVLYITDKRLNGCKTEFKPGYYDIIADDWIDASDVHADFMKKLEIVYNKFNMDKAKEIEDKNKYENNRI